MPLNHTSELFLNFASWSNHQKLVRCTPQVTMTIYIITNSCSCYQLLIKWNMLVTMVTGHARWTWFGEGEEDTEHQQPVRLRSVLSAQVWGIHEDFWLPRDRYAVSPCIQVCPLFQFPTCFMSLISLKQVNMRHWLCSPNSLCLHSWSVTWEKFLLKYNPSSLLSCNEN